MTLKLDYIKEGVVRVALSKLHNWSVASQELLLGTAAVESDFGAHLEQINGPAIGLWGMEPATHDSLWDDFIEYRKKYKKILEPRSVERLYGDWVYAAQMARIKYMTIPELLPASWDIDGMANYWKKYYNTPAGKGTVEVFVKKYRKYVMLK
ncbi:MAG: hypothetical protein ACPG47_00095 [Leucothrix sp.]